MINIVCVLRSGGDYDGDYVLNLYHMVSSNMGLIQFRFVCYTDFADRDLYMLRDLPIILEPLKKNYPGWWSKVEVFRSVSEPCLFFDLDTAIIKNLMPVVECVYKLRKNEFVGIRAFNPMRNKKPETEFNSGMMAWNGCFRYIYEDFSYIRDSRNPAFCGDQDYISMKLREHKTKIYFWQDVIDGIYSYKIHIKPQGKDLPNDTRIVCFHGKPRPRDVLDLPWLKKCMVIGGG